jgi:inosine/xanthosine triphosphatase
VLAVDGMPIKATRVANGEIDREGNFVSPPRVAVGSTNRIKVDSVREAFNQVFDDVQVKGFSVDTGVAKQPIGNATIKGAENRAKKALDEWSEKKPPHFAIGLEAGLFKVTAIKRYMDVQYCAILDMSGRFTYGHSPGFYYPSSFDEHIKAGEEIEDIIDDLFAIKKIGEKNGAIGFLTDNVVTRKDLLVSSVLMALVPRLKRELY